MTPEPLGPQNDDDILASLGIRYDADLNAPTYTVDIHLENARSGFFKGLKRPARKRMSYLSDAEYARLITHYDAAETYFSEPRTFTTMRPPSKWTAQDFQNLIDTMGLIMDALPLAGKPRWQDRAFGNGWLDISMQRATDDGHRDVAITLRTAYSVNLQARVLELNPAVIALWFASHPPFRIIQNQKGSVTASADHRTPGGQSAHEYRVKAVLDFCNLLEQFRRDSTDNAQ